MSVATQKLVEWQLANPEKGEEEAKAVVKEGRVNEACTSFDLANQLDQKL